MSTPRYVQPFSAIVWNNVAVAANGQSQTLHAWDAPWVSVFGTTSGSTTITLMYSADGSNWYAGPSVTASGAGSFHLDVTTGAEFLALQSSAAVTLTAIISAKG